MPLPPWEETTADDSADDLFINPPATDPIEPVVPQEEGGGNVEGGKFPDNIHRSRDRKKKQRVRANYSKIREDAQLLGVIPTTPEGAVRNEVVDPKTQSEQVFPDLISTAVRKGWAVPEERKPQLVDELIAVIDDPEESAKLKIAAFNALRLADQQQYERDHPEEIAKKGGHSISVQANIQAVAVLRGMVEAGEIGTVAGHITDDKVREPDDSDEEAKESEEAKEAPLTEKELAIEALLAPMRGVNRK